MKMMTTALASLLAAGAAVPAQAQTSDAPMADMDHGAAHSGTNDQNSADKAQMDQSQMDHSQMDHSGMDMAGIDHAKTDHGKMDHAGMDMAGMGMAMAGMNHDAGPAAYGDGSGTSRLPGKEGVMRGLSTMTGGWMLMAHGYLTLDYTDHEGPRGDDLLYSTSMLMLSAQKDFTGGRLQLRSMMSLEPTMAARGYPNLFATGETAGGAPIVDRQHPHDLFMELAARVDLDVAPGTRFILYGGPVGEPALGPSAFMHRASAQYNPEPPITHHWFDSTHITYGVVTMGLGTAHWQIEGSAFRGREPDEQRWNIETPKLDSWSARLSWTPDPHWAAQISHGFLKAPESNHGGENELRTTASVHYNGGGLSGMLAFSAKDRSPGPMLTAWLAEANYDLTPRHSLFARVENVDNEELVPDESDPLHDQPFRITKMQAGYAWNTPLGESPFRLVLGGSANLYAKPAALDRLYGRNPWGYTLFVKLLLGR